MNKKHEDMVKGFTQLSRAWYGKGSLLHGDFTDAIYFGFYGKEDGGTTGEMCVKWIRLGGKTLPRLCVFSDAWSALSEFTNLIKMLGEHDDEDPSPEQFCEYLLQCGFIDRTETMQHY